MYSFLETPPPPHSVQCLPGLRSPQGELVPDGFPVNEGRGEELDCPAPF